MTEGFSVFLSTLNCGKNLPIAELAKLGGVIETLVPSQPVHDIYVLGFQELVPIWQGSFPELVQCQLQDISRAVLKLLNQLESHRTFKLATLNSVGAIGLLVFVDDRYITTSCFKTSVKCGMLYSSLKGATAAKLTLQNPETERMDSFIFVTAHLAANEGEAQQLKRESDYHTIVNELERELGSFNGNHVFFSGDLNFRSSKWTSNLTDYQDAELVREAISKHDELTRSRRANRIFLNFQEPPILFAPSYKFMLSGLEAYHPARTPSWCDRILFQNYEKPLQPKIIEYSTCKRTQALQFTDHLPVFLQLKVPHIEMKLSATTAESSANVARPGSHAIGSLADYTIGYFGYLSDRYGSQVAVVSGILVLWLLYNLFT
ncbi:LADA_0B08042g1_1 [Lachancea dasiensis]|uniref:LADA_0B08042g1_1 n=1 Tax=Lachancea dasiensis TaxID=1072105 RepID=A0A1G4IUF0_9SACH|nr:LADA_0B08042g1_1 [Lachancea dasiensis]